MSQQNGGSSANWTHTDSLIAGVIAAIAGVSVVLWFAGQLGAILIGNGWPHVEFMDIFTIGFGVITHPFSPSEAWPANAQDQIPPALIYWILLVLLVGGGVFLGTRIYDWVRNGGQGGFLGGGRNGLGADKSTWARRGSLKQLVVPGPIKGRMILGHAQGKLVATEPRQSVIVMGPSQSGKTTGLAIPAILEWDGPVIATSVKTDLARDTLEWRKKMGRVWVYDPTNATSLPGSTWSPLDGAKTWGGAKKIANWLVSAGQSEKSGLNDAQFWYTAAGKLLAPHLFAAAANGYTMADVVRWIDTQEDFELRALLQATGVEEAIQAAEASWQREERARSSIYTTAEVVIEAYSDPTVLESARTSAIQPDTFFDGGAHTLYVCAPGHEQARLRPVFSTLLKQFITAAYEKSSSEGGVPMDPPLLICLDEAANIAPLSDLDSIASTAAGHGIQLMTVWQDLSQIKARYSDRAQTVINNHRAKVVLSGISDTESLDYVSRLVGSEEVKQVSFTTDAEGRRQKTESRGDKNLAPSDVLRRIKQNEGVLVYGALLPSRLILRPWYKNRILRARAQGLATAESAFPNHTFDGAGEIGGVENPPGSMPAPQRPEAPPAQRNPYGNPYSSPYGAPPSNPYGAPPANPYGGGSNNPYGGGGAPGAAGAPGSGSGASGNDYPPIEDLFDFSEFSDWEDDDDEPAPRKAPDGAPGGQLMSPSNPTNPGDNSEAQDRFAAAMDEWLKMFPETQQGKSEDNPEEAQPKEIEAPPAPSTSQTDSEYEEFLEWKRSRQTAHADAAQQYEQAVKAHRANTEPVAQSEEAEVKKEKKDSEESSSSDSAGGTPLYGNIDVTKRNNSNGNGSNGSAPDDEDGDEPHDSQNKGRYFVNGKQLGGSVPAAKKPKK